MTIAKVAGGVALIGVSAPVLATAGAAIALPAVGFTGAGIAAGQYTPIMPHDSPTDV